MYKELMKDSHTKKKLEKMRWMNLEPSIQSEVSQKKKNKNHILIHIDSKINPVSPKGN